ncbi:MAG: orotate phosphoribosyltransferase [Chloroflexota bacterium]
MSQQVEDIFREAGAILEGHFELTSGLHSPVYWEKFRVLSSPPHVERLCRIVAQQFRGEHVDLVAGPTVGGIIIAFEVAKQMGTKAIYAERAEDGRDFRRGLTINRGDRVLVVDDVLTTGSSTLEVVKAVERYGGSIAGVAVLVDRSPGGVAAVGRYPLFSCHRSSTPTYSPEECPLCAQGVPLTKPGSSQPRLS